jgi:hypothetical protein
MPPPKLTCGFGDRDAMNSPGRSKTAWRLAVAGSACVFF